MRTLTTPILMAAFALLMALPTLVLAQKTAGPALRTLTLDRFVGTYKGTAKRPKGDINFTLEIKSENGKAAGRMFSPQHPELQITSGEITYINLTLKLSSASNTATLVLHPEGDKLVGEWQSAGESGVVELTKVPVEPSLAEILTGEWEAVADVHGEALPFSLTLKIEGEKVTGSTTSQLGTSTITSGSFKDGKLVFVLESANSQIGMMAALVEGKLVGDFDFSGQMQGKWVATKRRP